MNHPGASALFVSQAVAWFELGGSAGELGGITGRPLSSPFGGPLNVAPAAPSGRKRARLLSFGASPSEKRGDNFEPAQSLQSQVSGRAHEKWAEQTRARSLALALGQVGSSWRCHYLNDVDLCVRFVFQLKAPKVWLARTESIDAH